MLAVQPVHTIRHDQIEYNRITIFFKLCEMLSAPERDKLLENLSGKTSDFHNRLLERKEHIFDPTTRDHQIFCSSFEAILPGPIILKKLNYQSARVGILTARGARGNNQLLLQEVLKALDAYMPIEFQYFIGDSEHNQRISALPGTSRKKVEILSNLIQGIRSHYRELLPWDGGHDYAELPEAGVGLIEIEPRYCRKGEIISFNKVVFYEDEAKNLRAARDLGSKFDNRLEVIDVNHFSTPLAVSQLIQALGKDPQKQDPDVLHMFDIDGTLLNPDASIILGAPHLGKNAVSQEEFAEIPHEILTGLKPDYSNFADPLKIIETIQNARQSGVLFRKKLPKAASNAGHSH